jgi:transposase
MPWKECHVMDERLRFVARLLEDEQMAPLCAEFGISRKTGYKIYDRYKDCGVGAFSDRSRRPHRQANRLPPQLEAVIVRLKREYPGWGAPKIREKLRRQSSALHLPAISTVHAVLDRHGLVRRRRRRRPAATGTELSRPTEPNALWCADYKGEFMLGNRRYGYPLTITDFASRSLLTCEALATTQEKFAFTVFERTFKEFGLPERIRTDNGVPFASAHALYGLSKLSVWWLRLGIHIERIQPGHPQQNGRHERMHLTLKKDATKPAAAPLRPLRRPGPAFRAPGVWHLSERPGRPSSNKGRGSHELEVACSFHFAARAVASAAGDGSSAPTDVPLAAAYRRGSRQNLRRRHRHDSKMDQGEAMDVCAWICELRILREAARPNA